MKSPFLWYSSMKWYVDAVGHPHTKHVKQQHCIEKRNGDHRVMSHKFGEENPLQPTMNIFAVTTLKKMLLIGAMPSWLNIPVLSRSLDPSSYWPFFLSLLCQFDPHIRASKSCAFSSSRQLGQVGFKPTLIFGKHFYGYLFFIISCSK